ncbi:MAG: hypothetical protein ACMXYC_00055 [Candidatus Woesearchaeota archaeon]
MAAIKGAYNKVPKLIQEQMELCCSENSDDNEIVLRDNQIGI